MGSTPVTSQQKHRGHMSLPDPFATLTPAESDVYKRARNGCLKAFAKALELNTCGKAFTAAIVASRALRAFGIDHVIKAGYARFPTRAADGSVVIKAATHMWVEDTRLGTITDMTFSKNSSKCVMLLGCVVGFQEDAHPPVYSETFQPGDILLPCMPIETFQALASNPDAALKDSPEYIRRGIQAALEAATSASNEIKITNMDEDVVKALSGQ